tara:strand:- start:224 stop:454 length:231 start_codon:yes stop_codon:yes gene_type:complete
MSKVINMMETLRTKFYVSDKGFLVIQQDSYEYGKETTFLLSPDQTEILLSKLPAFIQEQSQSWSGFYESEPTDDQE